LNVSSHFFAVRYAEASVSSSAMKSIHSNNRSLKQISNRLRRALLPAFAEN
jgi:hypothetical protein